MYRARLVLLGLPHRPPKPLHSAPSSAPQASPPPSSRLQHQHQPPPVAKETLDFASQKPSAFGAIGVGSTVKISFCTSCSYKGNAVTMTKMLEAAFPGIHVELSDYPPPLPKRVVSKLVPVAQVGVFGIIMAGEQIFPMLGITTPPAWYYSLRANRFSTIASTWLLGNELQSFLQSTGAFEVYLNDELVFSKLKEGRFAGEIELRDAIASKLGSSRITDSALWS